MRRYLNCLKKNNKVHNYSKNNEGEYDFMNEYVNACKGENSDVCFYFTINNSSYFYIFDFVQENNQSYIYVKKTNCTFSQRNELLQEIETYKQLFFLKIANKIAELCFDYNAKYDFYHNHIMPFGFQDSERINKLIDEIIANKINSI